MNTRARRAYPFYIFLPSSFLCASWHKFCCKPSLCKDNFSQTASHILKQLCTSSSEQRLDEGRDGFTSGALYLATAWLRSKVAQVTPRCGTEERFSPFPLPPFVSSSLCPFVSSSLCPFVSSSLCPFVSLTLSLFDSLTLRLFDSLTLPLVFMMFLLYFCNWLECVTAF